VLVRVATTEEISAVMTSDITVRENLLDASGMLKTDESELTSWKPIAKGKGYTGRFDGNGHKIKGIYCCTEDKDVGFFGIIEKGGEVKDLGISDSFFVLKKSNDLGAVAGKNHGKVIGCYSEATLYNNGLYNYKGNVGGIVGTNNGKISGCYNGGIIYESDINSSYLGGIVGINEFGSTVENCYNLGKIYSNTTSSKSCGGIAGISYGNIEYCYNRGNITSCGEEFSEDTNSCLGGVVGVLEESGKVKKCWNEGALDGSSQCVGGLVGHLRGGKIDNGYNVGNILSGKYSAGLAGYVTCEAEISY
jgi:hypothetical protein